MFQYPSERNLLIEKLYESGNYRKSELAKQFNLSKQRIDQIVNREKHNARLYVRGLVKNGKINPAKELKCFDCNNQAIEYDHYKGYDLKNRMKIQPVCKRCTTLRYVKRGEVVSGEKHYEHKLSKKDILEMKKLRKQLGKKMRYKQIGLLFNVTEQTAFNYINYENYQKNGRTKYV